LWCLVRARLYGRRPKTIPRRPDDFARYLKEQRERFADIIKKNNIRIE
jgi:hypothetical protein